MSKNIYPYYQIHYNKAWDLYKVTKISDPRIKTEYKDLGKFPLLKEAKKAIEFDKNDKWELIQ